jgi:hypothetical protein
MKLTPYFILLARLSVYKGAGPRIKPGTCLAAGRRANHLAAPNPLVFSCLSLKGKRNFLSYLLVAFALPVYKNMAKTIIITFWLTDFAAKVYFLRLTVLKLPFCTVSHMQGTVCGIEGSI